MKREKTKFLWIDHQILKEAITNLPAAHLKFSIVSGKRGDL